MKNSNNVTKNGLIDLGNGEYEAYFNGKFVGRSVNKSYLKSKIEKMSTGWVPAKRGRKSYSYNIPKPISYDMARFEPTVKEEADFHINERFAFVEKGVNMIAQGVQPSLIITGSGGLGKTYTVRNTLENAPNNLIDLSLFTQDEEFTDEDRASSYVMIKGYSTAKAMYRSLWVNNNSVIVFDDCDSVLNDKIAVNILKAALDSYDKRVISWGTELRDDDLPQRFEFTGRVIFITNKNRWEIDQAIRSRSMIIDVAMSLQETVDRMSTIIEDESFLPEYPMWAKKDALEFISNNKEKANELTLRTLITICKVRYNLADDENWSRMAEYVICVN